MRIANPTAQRGEEIACNYLKKKGYKIIDRNFRKGYGEIDIIAIDNGVLVFIEVKTSNSNFLGSPLEHINYYKLKTLKRSAEFYKMIHPELPESMRLDAVSIMLSDGSEPKIELVKSIT
ncbi:MAG: YraN family protein [Patescibacteria group bacterium]